MARWEGMNAITILVVHHSPTPTARSIADAVLTAARDAAAEVAESMGDASQVRIVERAALEPDVEELLAADAVILGTTANFGYISGALKHYFDSTFVAAHEPTAGLPVSWWIRGGYDTTGAEKAMRSLTTGMNWEIAAEPVEFVGDPSKHADQLVTMAQSVVGAAVMASEKEK